MEAKKDAKLKPGPSGGAVAKPAKRGFDTLPLSEGLIERLKAEGFTQPTPVQAASIPQFLSNRDVVVEACTGSGKTLAYVLPVLEILLRTREERKGHPLDVGGVILSPTRELASQIARVAKPFCESVSVTFKLLTSGDGKSKQDITSTEPWELLIGTPGRLDEWTEANKHRLKRVEVLVMDEADSLLGPNYEKAVQAIVSRLPKQRRTGLFSATQAKEVEQMVRAGLRNPATISVKVLQAQPQSGEEPVFQKTPNKLSNYYLTLPPNEKLQFIYDFIASHPKDKIIVFFATCASVDYFGDGILKTTLRSRLFPMHGRMNPKRRTLTFESFVKSENGVLTCTDVLARGIDLPDVDWIIQVDCPKEPDFFVHRVGRTARAGRIGSAVLLLMPNELAYVEFLKSQKVPLEVMPEALSKFEPAKPPVDIHAKARELIFSDRDFLERGTRAFVAYMAYYGEHRLSAIFRIKELDMLPLVQSFHLLRLPKLKEFRDKKILEKLKDFKEEPSELIANIQFKDKAREEKRKKLLAAGSEFNQGKREANQKDKLMQDNKRPKEDQKEDAKRRRKGKQERMHEEWDELAKEHQLYRKAKKGKIDAKKYEKALLGEADSDDSDDE